MLEKMNRAKKALVNTVLSISLLLLASNCFADTNSTSSYDWVNKTIDVCKAVDAVAILSGEIGMMVFIVHLTFRAVIQRRPFVGENEFLPILWAIKQQAALNLRQ
jgi:hypothetical protein